MIFQSVDSILFKKKVKMHSESTSVEDLFFVCQNFAKNSPPVLMHWQTGR